jgi:hypothetical protein
MGKSKTPFIDKKNASMQIPFRGQREIWLGNAGRAPPLAGAGGWGEDISDFFYESKALSLEMAMPL